MSNRILFFGRENCKHTKKAINHLKNYDAQLTIILSKSRENKLPNSINKWQGEYILCFRSYLILSQSIINKARIAAINFHPGPPEHPGTGCVNFALYNNDENFGCTVHLIEKAIDSGKILDTCTFPILPTDNVNSLLQRTHKELYKLFCNFTDKLLDCNNEMLKQNFNFKSKYKWSRKARTLKDLNMLQTSDVNIDKYELIKRIRATNTEDFPTSLIFHGHVFELKKR